MNIAKRRSIASASVSVPSVSVHGMLIASLVAISSSAMAEEAAPDTAAQGLGEIVVTAQKRQENLQDVPVAVTALSQATIDNLQIQNVSNLSGVAPGLYVGPASGSQATITIRGIVGGNPSNGTDAAVALYVDGVYLSRLTGATFDVADLERIEVLRGPQGTLYGRNSTGGAINFIAAKPKGEFYARQEVTVGNLGKLRTKTRIDTPRIGAFSLSASFLHDEDEGYVRNTQAGTVWNFSDATGGSISGDRVSPRKLGARNTEAARIALRYAPESTPLTVDYSFDTTSADYANIATQTLDFPTTGAGNAARNIYAAQPDGHGVVSLTRLDAVPNGFATPEHLKVFGHNLTTTYPISDRIELKSISGYRGFRTSFSNQIGGDGSLIDPSGATQQSYQLFAIAQFERSRQFSQEVQISYRSDVLDAIGGLYYFREKTTSKSPLYIMQLVPSDPFAGFSPSYSDATSHNRSIAAFGQVTVHATDELDLTAGIRGTRDKRRTDSRTVIAGQPIGDFRKTFEHVDWSANAAYRPGKDVMLYVKVGTGYLSGGVFNGSRFEPETLTQYEVGAKAEFLDQRLRVNAVAYRSDYRDLQGQAPNAAGISIFQNIGKAKVTGAELEVTALPLPDLVLNASYGYTRFVYQEYIRGGVDVADVTKRPKTPKHNLVLGAQWNLPEIGDGMQPSLNIDARWHSKMFLSSFISTYSPELNRALRNNDFWDIDARATLARIDLGGATGKASTWVKNLLDKRKIVNATDLSFVVQGQFNRPRTYGVDFSVEF